MTQRLGIFFIENLQDKWGSDIETIKTSQKK